MIVIIYEYQILYSYHQLNFAVSLSERYFPRELPAVAKCFESEGTADVFKQNAERMKELRGALRQLNCQQLKLCSC